MFAATVHAADADAGNDFFEKKIRPVLVQHCFECHSTQSKKRRGGLLLDSREGLRKGGDSGPAFVAEKSDQSLLLKAVRYTDENLKMPPKGKLPDAVIADIEAWARMGAPDPRRPPSVSAVVSSKATTWPEILKERRDWWSLLPVRKPEPPSVKNTVGPADPVDRFLLAKLEATGLTPAAPTDPRTLIRRFSLVLTGLPPTPAEIGVFLADCETQRISSGLTPHAAVERLVDRLLASPHFGERWARHWMDVVRFTETHGNEWNYEVHHAWRYRDYLIRAFNDDVPYDQFVREHIAGDSLPNPRWNRRERFNESVIATASYRFGEVAHDDCIGLPTIGYDLADNQVDTLTKAFQATTVACARCHDHKIDAVSMQDYYALLGMIRGSRQVSHTIDAPEVNAEALKQLQELKSAIRKDLSAVWRKDAGELGRYLLVAQAKKDKRADAAKLAQGLDPKRIDKWVAALGIEKAPIEDVLQPWRMLTAAKPANEASSAEECRKLAERYQKEDRERGDFNQKRFTDFADFRNHGFAGWQATGMGLREGLTASGDFTLSPTGDTLVTAILPAGCFTHALSDKLNGALRSPLIPAGTKQISFQVIGKRSSALRLVSNNCQLNYRNYRALTSDDWQWVTYSPPENSDSLRVYAELMTMFDNPKFPDQLSSLGGDKEDYKLPWEKAAANPRSYFGVTRVVVHDGAEPPKLELTHLRPLFAGETPKSTIQLAERYAAVVEDAVRAWGDNRASDEHVSWLDGLLRRGLLGNATNMTPRLTSLIDQYRSAESRLELPRIAPGLGDVGPGCEQPIFTRGDCLKPGDKAPRRYLEVLSKPAERFASAGSGRLDLAERIASPHNPLTARVLVNRVWHHLFGNGLVRTVDDFGRVGEAPSHPEMLDYLAARFVEDGWSIKRLIRALVLTDAFQAANVPSRAAKEIDPLNRLLQHYPSRRMEAETLRDAILTVSGRLDRTPFGMSVPPYRAQSNVDRRLFAGPLDGNGRRSVYIKNTLMEAPQFLAAFNFPGGKVAQGRRDQTNVPAQALALLNDPFVHQQAAVWSDHLIDWPDVSTAARIERMFQAALGRPPDNDERERFEQALAQFAEPRPIPADSLLKDREIWKDLAHALFNLKEFSTIP